MKTVRQIQALFGNGDQHVGVERNLYLRFDHALVGTTKRLDAQALLYPFGEQIDLSALAVKVCDQLGFEGQVVVQKSPLLARPIPARGTSQLSGIVFNE